MDNPRLLNQQRLNGPYQVERRVSPYHQALLVDRTSLAAGIAAVRTLCETWGGGCHLLIPHDPASTELAPTWKNFVGQANVNGVATNDLIEAPGPSGRREAYSIVGTEGLGFPLVSLIANLEVRRDDWGTVSQTAPEDSDPWFVSYLASFGDWHAKLDPRKLALAGLREDLAWDDLLPVHREVVVGAGAVNLLQRLRSPGISGPILASLVRLSLRPGRRNAGLVGGPEVLPKPSPDLSLVGPNIVVLYEPGSVNDLCLIWNLRAAHGLRPGLPLAVPVSADVPRELHLLVENFAPALFGIGGDRRFCLTSCSVPREELQQIAAVQPANWQVAPFESLLVPPSRPAMLSHDLAFFEDGVSRLAALSQNDRRVLGGIKDPRTETKTIFIVDGDPLPPSPTLAGDWLDSRYREGGFETRPARQDVVAMRWPTGWTVLEALIKDRGLRARPSGAGRAAAALIAQLGGVRRPRPSRPSGSRLDAPSLEREARNELVSSKAAWVSRAG